VSCSRCIYIPIKRKANSPVSNPDIPAPAMIVNTNNPITFKVTGVDTRPININALADNSNE